MANKKFSGFTLVELLIVIVIISILATMAVPQYQKMIWKARWATAFTTLDAIRKAELSYYSQRGEFADGIPDSYVGTYDNNGAIGGDYADDSDDINNWLAVRGMDITEIPAKACEYFTYDVGILPAGQDSYCQAVRRDSADIDPVWNTNYGIRINLLTGQVDYDPNKYP